MAFVRTLAALALAGLIVAPSARAETLDRPAVEAIIKDYLVAHPEVVEDALNELQARKAAAEAERQMKLVSANMDAIEAAPQNVVLGNPEGNVTLVEFFDYNCGYCKRGLSDILELIEKDKDLKIVLKDYPILSPGSIEAATVALAVKQQLKGEKFLEFHKELMLSRGQVGKDRALEVAKANGVDMAKLDAAIASPALRQSLADNVRLGDTLGVSGTPSYVIGKEIVGGAVGFAALQSKIEAVRQCGQTSC